MILSFPLNLHTHQYILLQFSNLNPIPNLNMSHHFLLTLPMPKGRGSVNVQPYIICHRYIIPDASCIVYSRLSIKISPSLWHILLIHDIYSYFMLQFVCQHKSIEFCLRTIPAIIVAVCVFGALAFIFSLFNRHNFFLSMNMGTTRVPD